jgi:hypothetical protein
MKKRKRRFGEISRKRTYSNRGRLGLGNGEPEVAAAGAAAGACDRGWHVTVEANGGVGRATAITDEDGNRIRKESLTWLGVGCLRIEGWKGRNQTGGNSDHRRHDHVFLGTVVWYQRLRHVTDLPAPARYSGHGISDIKTSYSRRYNAPSNERSY